MELEDANYPERVARLAKLELYVKEYVEGYEFYGETAEGHEASHTPTRFEGLLIDDAINGLMAEDEFVKLFNHWQEVNHELKPVQPGKAGEWTVGVPHLMDDKEDCMGNPITPWWRVFADRGPGTTMIGTGNTADEALADAARKMHRYDIAKQ